MTHFFVYLFLYLFRLVNVARYFIAYRQTYIQFVGLMVDCSKRIVKCMKRHDEPESSYGSAGSTGLHGPLNVTTAD